MKKYEKPVSTDVKNAHYAGQSAASAFGAAFGKAFASGATAKGVDLKVEIPSAFAVK